MTEDPTPSAKDVVQRFLAAAARRDDPAITVLIHPTAVWETLALPGTLREGRLQILDVIRTWRKSAEAPVVERVEELDPGTALLVGRRRRLHAGAAEETVAWLAEVRDGMIWRLRVFPDERRARDAYGAGGSGSGAS